MTVVGCGGVTVWRVFMTVNGVKGLQFEGLSSQWLEVEGLQVKSHSNNLLPVSNKINVILLTCYCTGFQKWVALELAPFPRVGKRQSIKSSPDAAHTSCGVLDRLRASPTTSCYRRKAEHHFQSRIQKNSIKQVIRDTVLHWWISPSTGT